jgi:hypothetical protein
MYKYCSWRGAILIFLRAGHADGRGQQDHGDHEFRRPVLIHRVFLIVCVFTLFFAAAVRAALHGQLTHFGGERSSPDM